MKAENLNLDWHAERWPASARGLAAIVARWVERARERHTLAHLDALTKRDLGLTDDDIWRETRKAPWQA